MSREAPRWWIALVPFPVLVGLHHLLVWLTSVLLPASGPTRSEALPVLLAGLGASLVGALVVATAPVFAVGAVLDVRALRARSAWTPHWGVGALGVLPVLGLVVEWVALLSIPAAVGYLALRRRRVGQPLGGSGSLVGGTTLAGGRSAGRPSSSRWWYGVVVPPVLELVGVATLWTIRSTGTLRGGSEPLALLLPVALVVLAGGLVPLFAVSLYLDARAVRAADADGTHDPRVWAALGLVSVLGLVVVRTTFMPVIAAAYLLGRRLVTGR